MSVQATVDGLAQGARVVRRLGGLVARDLAVLVALVAAEVRQLLDERGARDGDEPGLEQRDAILVREPRSAAIGSSYPTTRLTSGLSVGQRPLFVPGC